jgi:hypothetical protein
MAPKQMTKEDFGGSASKLARELLRQSKPEVVGLLDIEDRAQMNELMGMRAGKRACGQPFFPRLRDSQLQSRYLSRRLGGHLCARCAGTLG